MRGVGVAVVVAVVAAAGMVAGCGDQHAVPQAAPSHAAASQAAPSQARPPRAADRFRVLFRESGDLVDRLTRTDAPATPSGPEEANRVAGLDDTSPLRFVELEQNGAHSGRWCLASDDDTYVSVEATQDDSTDLMVFLSDNACAHTEAEAAVVGNMANGTWSKGAGLMGDEKVADVFPAAELSAEGVDDGEVDPAALDPQLLVDLSALAYAVAEYGSARQAYPAAAPSDLVGALSVGTAPVISSQNRVFAYRHGQHGFALCLVDEHGNWARWNRLGQISTGTYARDSDLARCAAPVSVDGAG